MLPTKSQIIVEFSKADQLWDYEVVHKVLSERNMDTEYWRNTAQFWCTELSGMAIIQETEYKVNSPEWGGRIAHRYSISEYGQHLAEMLQKD